MRVLAKTIPYKNLSARLFGSKRNGRYSSMVKNVTENYQNQNDGHVIENSGKSGSQIKPVTGYSNDKLQSISLPLQKGSVSNFKFRVNSSPLSEAKNSVKRKFSLSLPAKSLSTSSIAWIKKSFKDVNSFAKSNPNYDYPFLSKIFGTEDLLMRSDAYNQALIEAARRRAALKESNNASKEFKNDIAKRPQVINIKGWGVCKTNKRAVEPKPQNSNSNPVSTKNMKQVDRDYTKDNSMQSYELWNADKSNLPHVFKSNIEGSKLYQLPKKPQNQTEFIAKRDYPCKPPNLQTESKIQYKLKTKPCSSKNCLTTAKPLKGPNDFIKKDDPCKPSYLCSGTKSYTQPEIKTKLGFTTANPLKRTNEVIKQDQPPKSSYPRRDSKSNTLIEMKIKPCLLTETPLKSINEVMKQNDPSKPSYLRSGTKSNTELEAKTKSLISKPCLKTAKTLKQAYGGIKKDNFCNSSNLWSAAKFNSQYRLKSETQSCSPSIKTQKSTKESIKKHNFCKPSEVWSASKTGEQKGLKPEPQTSNTCPPTANLKKQADGGCKKNDPCKPSDPCKPTDSCKEELDKIKKREEDEKNKNRNKMPTGCVDPKCQKDDVWKKPPKSPQKFTSTHRRMRKRPSGSLTAIRHLRGCENKGEDKSTKPNCKDHPRKEFKPNDIQKSTEEVKSPCVGNKIKDQNNYDPCKNKDLSESSKQKDNPCGSKKINPCQDKKLSPCGSRNESTKDPCKNDQKNEGPCKEVNPIGSSKQEKDISKKNIDSCESNKQNKNISGSKSKDSSTGKKPSPCAIRKEETKDLYKETKEPCKKLQEPIGSQEQKENQCGSGKQKVDPCKKPQEPSESNKQKENPCVSDKQKADPCKKPENTSGSTKQKENPCGTSKQKADPCKKPEGTSESNLKKENSCGSGKQKVDPCKKPEEMSTSSKQKENSFGSEKKDSCLDKKSSPCSSRKEEPIRDPRKTFTSAEKKEPTSPCKPAIVAKQEFGKQNRDTKPNCSNIKESFSNSGSRKENSVKDPCKATASGAKKEETSSTISKTAANQDCGKPKKETKPNCSNMKESSSSCDSGKEKVTQNLCKAPPSVEKKESTSPCKSNIAASQKFEETNRPTKLSCSNIKESLSNAGSRKDDGVKDPCKATASGAKKEETSSNASKTPVSQDCGKLKRETKPNCSNLKKSSSFSGKESPTKDPCKTKASTEKKEPASPCKPKTAANQDFGRTNRDTKLSYSSINESSSTCGNRTENYLKDPCKASASAAKKEETRPIVSKNTASQECGKPKRETKPNCGNIKESSSSSGKEIPTKDPCKAKESTEKQIPTSPCKPKIAANQDFRQPNREDTKPSCSDIKKSSSTCGSRSEDTIKVTCKAAASVGKKVETSPIVSKTDVSQDCEKTKRETKPNCSNIKESTSSSGKEDSTKDPCQIKRASKKESINIDKLKTATNRDCGMPKRDTKPNCSNMKKSFSTLTISASQSLSSMIKRTLTTLQAIGNNSFIRNYSSKSRDKNKIDQKKIGRASQCKSVGTTVPAKRKPAFNPHPNENLRHCYPTYDMDCRKLCKDARKTDCKKFAFLEETNTNKRKGQK